MIKGKGWHCFLGIVWHLKSYQVTVLCNQALGTQQLGNEPTNPR